MPTNMDVDSTESASLERQELEGLRLLAVERCPEMLVKKQKAVADIQALIEAKRCRKGGQPPSPLCGNVERCWCPSG